MFLMNYSKLCISSYKKYDRLCVMLKSVSWDTAFQKYSFKSAFLVFVLSYSFCLAKVYIERICIVFVSVRYVRMKGGNINEQIKSNANSRDNVEVTITFISKNNTARV